jgi:uncharacterized 2Fe-2S/4Fe-4S cluster protein (DUF4445 family)
VSKIFFPQFKKGKQGIEIEKGNILNSARKLGIEIPSECGGKGLCGKCRVRVEGEDALNPRTEVEKNFKLGRDERLACQARVIRGGSIRVFIKSIGRYAILSDTIQGKVKLDPFVYRKDDMVFWQDREVGKFRGGIYGLAIDVGTTTLVSQIIDLESGERIVTFADKNPQASFGDDVISRIDYTMRNKDGLRELQNVVIEGINAGLRRIAEEKGEILDRIYEAVVVGNSTMRSIFFGVDVSSLGVIPFEPLTCEPLNRKAKELSLEINPQANVYGAPLIGGHAGADALADIIATGLYQARKPSMVIDIGTNGEVVIGNKERILTASCAAGGAYEGATISSGVGAVEGAIKNVKIINGRVQSETIGNKPALGICGSGLIDLLGELLKNGIMSKKAKLKDDFFITPEISISQQDIYQLITAKAGLRLDQDLLIKYYSTTLEEVNRIYLSGAFGNFINPDNAILIGLLPRATNKVVRIGNGALAGASQMLLSREKRKDAEKIARKIEHIKPNEREENFSYMIAEKMYFEDEDELLKRDLSK